MPTFKLSLGELRISPGRSIIARSVSRKDLHATELLTCFFSTKHCCCSWLSALKHAKGSNGKAVSACYACSPWSILWKKLGSLSERLMKRGLENRNQILTNSMSISQNNVCIHDSIRCYPISILLIQS